MGGFLMLVLVLVVFRVRRGGETCFEGRPGECSSLPAWPGTCKGVPLGAHLSTYRCHNSTHAPPMFRAHPMFPQNYSVPSVSQPGHT